LGPFGSLRWRLHLSRSLSCSGSWSHSLGLGLWPAEPMTLGHVGTNSFQSLRKPSR
jgi:hypothetical protein